MTLSEILRQLADMVDGREEQSLGDTGAVPDQVMPADTYENPQEEENAEAGEVFLPPLQMKLELLKKATGVNNVYDDGQEQGEEQHSYDELDAIKRNAGISVVALDALGDDEPLEG
jgi:hypothetical protein